MRTVKLKGWVAALTASLALSSTGCADKSAFPTSPSPTTNLAPVTGAPGKTNVAAAPGFVWNVTKAQPKLPTLKLYVGKEVITAELALSDPQIRTGMMFRESMAENDGMLFVFRGPYQPAFYMKNTTLALTAAYIDPDGVIQELVELQPLNETPVEAKSSHIQFVLEMNRGWFQRHNIAPGAVLTTERGPLLHVFGR